MSGTSWVRHALSLELRKLLGYRADFWLEALGSVGVQFAIAYFLWRTIFDTRGVDQIGGYGFGGLMLYYLLVPFVERISRGQEIGFLSQDIYEGSLTRYLVYPVDFFAYKYVQQLAMGAIGVLQLLIGFALFVAVFGLPEGIELQAWQLPAGLLAALTASLLYFLLGGCLEMVSFWADNVWSLLVMLRFAIRLLGGGMIPLALFPESWAEVLHYLPFSSLLDFPIRTLMGRVDAAQFAIGMLLSLGWIVAVYLVARTIFARGARQYTGVGI